MSPPNKARSFQDLIAFQGTNGELLAFHARNLEVAEISQEAWESFQSSPLAELQAWHTEDNPVTKSYSKASKVRSLNINVTQVCNLHCVYCAAGGDGTYGNPIKKISVEKTLPQLKWFFEKLDDDESFNITFLGGEPLLYPEGIRLISEYALETAKKKNNQLKLRVVTNGTLFTSPIVDMLNELKIDITVSLDGPAETNDKARPGLNGKGLSEEIRDGLNLLLKNRTQIKEIGVRGVFGAYNLEVEKAYDYFSQIGFDRFEFNFDLSCGDKNVSDQFVLQMEKVALKSLQKGESHLRKIRFFDDVFNQLDNQLRLENFCGSGKSFAVLDSANQVFLCPWEVSDPKLQISYLSNDLLQTIEKTLIEQNNCHSCWARFLCGGGCMYAHLQTTGKKNKPDPIYCDRTRSLISTTIMHYYSLRKVAYANPH